MTDSLTARGICGLARLPCQILLVGILYALLGWAGFFLALPPGYATIVWLPSGLALTVLLHGGPRLWPGVWLGSCLINCWIGWSATGMDSAGLIVAVLLGFGAALQALLGQRLVRAVVGYPTPLARERDIAFFFLYGGPISCLVAASWGVLMLIVFRRIAPAAAPINWITWWSGDVLGVLTVAPLVLLVIGRPRAVWRRRWASVALPLVASLVFVVTAFVYVRAHDGASRQARFRQRVAALHGPLQDQIDDYIDALYTLRAFFAGSQRVERDEFDIVASHLRARFRGMQALEWIPLVRGDERAAFVSGARAEGFPDFDIRESTAAGELIPAPAREVYYPVSYVVPLAGNEPVLGFDMRAEPIRRAAFEAAAATGEPVVSQSIDLVQGLDDQPACLAVLPLFESLPDQQHRLLGFILAAFRVGDMMQEAFAPHDLAELSIKLFDLSDPFMPVALYSTGPPPETAIEMVQVYDVIVGGRSWQTQFRPALGSIALKSGLAVWVVLCGGLILVGLLSVILLANTGRTMLIEQTVEERTAELRESAGALQAANQQLDLAIKTAQAADKAKGEFVANVSHELRTPMNGILGYAELLDNPGGEDQPSLQECVATIRRNGEHLLMIINDILDFSKIDAGHMDIDRQPFSPFSIASEVASLMRPRAEEHGLSLTVEQQTPIPGTINSDPHRVRQVLVNLVGNAIKFTEKGSVVIELAMSEGESGPRLRLAVRDTGIGIDRAAQASLFEPFSQVDAGPTRRFGGTGLGLAISQRIAALLEGEIVVESELGKGTTMAFLLPVGSLDGVAMIEQCTEAMLQTIEPKTPVPPARIDLSGVHILLVEDGIDNQALIGLHLRRAGAEVTVAENGSEALAQVMPDGAEPRPFDVILMDMQMPVMDGYEATRRLRQSGYTGRIVALTAHAMEGDRGRCLAVGCDDYATKPIGRDRLLEVCSYRQD